MLSYVNIDISNDPYRGGILIKGNPVMDNIGDIGMLVISRRLSGSTAWNDMHVISVSTLEHLNFELLDVLTLSGSVYDYKIDLLPDATENPTPIEFGIIEDVHCWFEGLYVGSADMTQSYIAGSNFKTETVRNMAVEYVTTLSSKYPHRISNSDLNYTTGISSGLFLELTANKKNFLPDNYHVFSNKVLNFLSDGSEKILRTHDGQGWLVSIDSQPNKIYSEYRGENAIQFTWTEIGPFPTIGIVDLTNRMAGELE